ncbi:hypothetical protein GCM10012287_55480 [Streptomyces daqingensis]|uniref:Uncharacterized protein n=1 Tax=Streptomyces daqingensis TaxID=1472640 RepID=A0ABQ2MY31_9ACTN|nr:DUF6191 domain-containing protein [Streptomyces daqingensis]GGO58095.1 hypothetical protein GCM10012287_55480 [Streptomyces daqingensis]
MTLPGLAMLLLAAVAVDQMLLRDDEEDGAPPDRTVVDLGSGTAVVRLPAP